MLLSRRLRFGFGFNLYSSWNNIKQAISAPKKHVKALLEPTGNEYSIQTNLTADGFDEVSAEWQAHFAGNPFDLQTYNYLEGAQLTNFGLFLFFLKSVCCTGKLSSPALCDLLLWNYLDLLDLLDTVDLLSSS